MSREDGRITCSEFKHKRQGDECLHYIHPERLRALPGTFTCSRDCSRRRQMRLHNERRRRREKEAEAK